MSRAIKTVILLTFVLISLPLSAQFYNVRGTVYESSTLKGLPGAAVKITDAEGKLVAGKQTSQNGQFLLAGVPLGNYTLTVSFVGFKTQTFALKLDGKGGNKKIADVLMREDAQLMRETVVEGKMPEMIVVEDTTVYNASAFTVPVGSMVEELIKKLPGIVIDDNGTITHNGKTVSQILVDGKEFFGRNQQTVLKNIPAEIVEKIKAYDKQSDLARVTGIDDGEEQTVLDLEIKKDRRRGWFGQLSAGYGTHNRYNGRANINRFADKQKFSVVGNANNTQGNGMSDNQTAAASMNLEWTKLELNGGVNANFNQQSGASWSNSQSFENRNAAYSNRKNNNNSNGKGITTTWRIEWKPDSMTNIQMRPEFRWNNSRSHSDSESATFNDDPYKYVTDPLNQLDILKGNNVLVNGSNNGSITYGDGLSTSAMLQYNRKLAKPGRNITLRGNINYSDNDNKSISTSRTSLYQLQDLYGNDSTFYTNRYNLTPSKSWSYSLQATYSEPIFRGGFLQFRYRFQYSYSKSDRSTYDFGNVGTFSELGYHYRGWDDYLRLLTNPLDYYLDDDLSRFSEYRNYIHEANITFRLINKAYNLNVGAMIQPQKTNFVQDYQGLHTDTTRNVVNLTPTLDFRYKFSPVSELRAEYRGSTSQPSMSDLLDITDDSNPMNIRKGNPGLKPSFNNRFELRYNNYIQSHQQGIMTFINYSNTRNSISNKTYYNKETGVRTTQPENINGNWNANIGVMYNFSIDSAGVWNVNNFAMMNHANNVNYLAQNMESVKNTTRSDMIMDRLQASYRKDWLEVALDGMFNYSHSKNLLQSVSNLDTWSFSYGGSINIYAPWGTTLSTDMHNMSRRGYNDSSMNTNELVWNAQVSQSFLKGNALTLSLQFYDILQNRSNFSRSVTADMRSDTQYNNINSYAMLHVIYRFNAFGGRHKQGEGGPGQFGRGGRGGWGGGRPGGWGGGRPGGGFGGGRRF